MPDQTTLNLNLRASREADLNVKGLAMQPGTFRPVVGDKPREVILTPEFVRAAYAVLKRDVDAGRVVVRLAHPGLGDLPLNYGRVKAVGIDHTTARVYVTDMDVDPAWDRILTQEAREKLYEFGFSVDARITFTPTKDGGLQAMQAIGFDGVDIVETGAFTGRGLLHEVPVTVVAQLLAQLTGTPAPGTESGAKQTKEKLRMPKLDTVESIPEDVRKQLSPEQQAAYLVAYNEAVEAGMMPEEAHQKAMTAAGALKPQGSPTNTDDMQAIKAQLARVQARAAEADRLDAEVKRLKAQAEQATKLEADLKQVRAQLATATQANAGFEERVRALEERAKAAEAEKEEILAQEDVKQVLATGKEKPHRREVVMQLRRDIGHEKFVRHYETVEPIVRAGEKGVVEQKPAAASDVDEARQFFREHGPAKVREAGLHTLQTPYGQEMQRLLAQAKAGER